MPIYEFECGKCEEVFEAMRPVSGGGSATCPACGSKRVRKLVSAFGISRPGLKLGSLSPVEKAVAEQAFSRKSRGRCCDNVCDPR
jgi:putative FmdB family regulatory protein